MRAALEALPKPQKTARKQAEIEVLAEPLRNPLAPILNVVQVFKQEGDGKQHLKEATGMVERALTGPDKTPG